MDMERLVARADILGLVSDLKQRAKLGDPLFVEGMDEYQADILKKPTIDRIRSKISDNRTQNVSAYDPQGIESLKTWVYSSHSPN